MKVIRPRLNALLTEAFLSNVEILELAGIDVSSRLGNVEDIALNIENLDVDSFSLAIVHGYITRKEFFFDRILAARFKDLDIFLAYPNFKHYTDNTIIASFDRIDDTRFKCVVTEKFVMSQSQADAEIYEHGQAVKFYKIPYNSAIDWILKILQCDSSAALKKISDLPRSNSLRQSLEKVFDESGQIKTEFKDLTLHEIIESNVDFNDLTYKILPDLVTEHWPFEKITRGWTDTYEFEVDFKDALLEMSESNLQKISSVEDRIISSMNEKCPIAFDFGSYDSETPRYLAEEIVARVRQHRINECFSSDQWTDKTIKKYLDYVFTGDYLYSPAETEYRIYLSLVPEDKSTDRYLFECDVYLESISSNERILCLDGEHIPLNDYIVYVIQKDDRYSGEEGCYDQIKEEIFDQVLDRGAIRRDSSIKFNFTLDFSDILESNLSI